MEKKKKKKKRIVRAIRRSLFGTTRRIRWVYGLATIFSAAVFAVLCCTNVFRDAILSNLQLRNGTPSFLLWQRPPVGLVVKVYAFNYTNLPEFESGAASKLRVQEVGPYVYRETLSRVNVEMHANQTVTYQEKRSYRWISGKSESERVTVPNVFLLSTIAYSRNLRYLAQIGLTVLLSSLHAKPFLDLSVGEYLWGYEDDLFRMAKPFAALKQPLAYDKFGMLVFRDGLNADRITMHTGADSLETLGLIERINGEDNRGIWGDEECDRVYGTDGTMFPPQWLEQPNSTIYIYAKDICRPLPFRYESRASFNGIPTLRYKLPSTAFASSPQEDSCFCPKESADSPTRTCSPAGTLNVSACKLGTPLLVSFPHFYSGDESLFERIEGLAPRRDLHESYVDLHPRLGVTVSTKLRLQLNLEVRKTSGVPFTGNLEDGAILPLLWIDSGVDDLPESIQRIFHRTHYLANAIEAGLEWCSLVAAILSLGALLLTFKGGTGRESEEKRGDDSSVEKSASSPGNTNSDTIARFEVDRS